MARITIKQLAEQLSLAPSTVSKALRDSYEISPETKQRVLEAAQRFNFTPNPYASSLRRKNSRTIAIVVPEVEDSFFSTAINGIEFVAHSMGYHVLIYLTHEDKALEESVLKDLLNGRVDGILISVSTGTKSAQHLLDYSLSGKPLVFFDRVLDEIPVHKVTTDDFEAGYLASKHLLENGCAHILFLSIGDSLNIMKRRFEGGLEAIREFRTDTKYQYVNCTPDPDEARMLIQNLLSVKNRPDGVIGAVEKLAIATYLACKTLRIRIPEELKVLAFSNLPIASLLQPGLSTVRQPAYEIGKTAASLLFERLNKNNQPFNPKSIVVPSVLEPRASTSGKVPF